MSSGHKKGVRGSAETVISDIAKTMNEIASFKLQGRWFESNKRSQNKGDYYKVVSFILIPMLARRPIGVISKILTDE